MAHAASVLSTFVAAAALVWSVLEFRTQTKINQDVLTAATQQQRESAAVELFNNYLTLAFQKPAFAFEEQDILKLPPDQGQRYTIFATAALSIAERIYVLTSPDPLWTRTVESIIKNHHKFVTINFSCKEVDPGFGAYLAKTVEGFTCP